jgi:hypothetical protein
MAQFEKGNPGGPGGSRPGAGRKPKALTQAAQQSLFGGIAAEDWEAIRAKAVEQAKAGDATARAWLFDRTFGKVPSPDVQAVHDQFHERFEAFQVAFLEEMNQISPELSQRVLARLQEPAGVVDTPDAPEEHGI